MSFEAGGRTFTGCTVEALPTPPGAWGQTPWASTARWDPKRSSPWQSGWPRLYRQLPVFVKPNAGLPRADGGGSPTAVCPGPALPGCTCCLPPAAAAAPPGVHQAAQRHLCRLHPGASRAPGCPSAVHPGGHGHGRRHHGGGRAHQPHRQKALPAGIAGRRHELCAGTGRQSGRGWGRRSWT